MPEVITPTVIDTNPQSRVLNGQPEGIGRVSVLDDFIAINNLGRNIEFSRWKNGKLQPFAVFQDTVFPGDDEPSQFDLDMHAITWTPGKENVLAVNHYGLVRLFKLSSNLDLQPEMQVSWPGDVERFAFAGGRLVSTSPQGYSVKDAAQPGLLISPPWRECVEIGGEIDYDVLFPSWGITTALASQDGLVAFAAGPRFGLTDVAYPSSLKFEMQLPFIVKWMQFRNSSQIVLAGFSLSGDEAGEEEWGALTGGGYAIVDLPRQMVTFSGEFDVDLAWGNGGVPLSLSEDGCTIVGVSKRGGMYGWDLENDGKLEVLYAEDSSDKELGIAHLDRLGKTLYCGFNRDGYRMRVYPAEGA